MISHHPTRYNRTDQHQHQDATTALATSHISKLWIRDSETTSSHQYSTRVYINTPHRLLMNNLDTYRYIKKSMPHQFKSFALGNLAVDLDLCHKKKRMDTSEIRFTMDWHSSTSVHNAMLMMIKYNMLDCEATIDLCFSLDLINQIIALCSITRSYVLDVMLYSTGAIAASCLCHHAHNRRCHSSNSHLVSKDLLFRLVGPMTASPLYLLVSLSTV